MGLADRDSLGAFLLPTSAQSLIQLNQRVQFISLRLRQGQFRGKRVCFVRQNLKVVRCPGFESSLDGLLIGQKQLFVLRLSQTNPGLQPSLSTRVTEIIPRFLLSQGLRSMRSPFRRVLNE